jgi:hypothetical protein
MKLPHDSFAGTLVTGLVLSALLVVALRSFVG